LWLRNYSPVWSVVVVVVVGIIIVVVLPAAAEDHPLLTVFFVKPTHSGTSTF